MKRLLGPALFLLGLAYPFFVYLNLDRIQPVWLAAAAAAMWLARALYVPSALGGRWLPALAMAGCVALALDGSQHALRWYPVMANALMLAAFAASLRPGQRPVIERLARLREPDLPPAGVRYTRRVTQVWTGFFLLNGLAAACLALWGSWQAWAWYNGAASYVLIGLLLAGEWLVRAFIIRPR